MNVNMDNWQNTEQSERADMITMTESLFDRLFNSGILSKDSLIYTNSVVSRRIEYYGILALGDDAKEILCPNRTILRYGGTECFPGQRLYCCVRRRKAVSYCAIPEMAYGELAEFFKETILFSHTASFTKKSQALGILTFLSKVTTGNQILNNEIKKFKTIAKSYLRREDNNVETE